MDIGRVVLVVLLVGWIALASFAALFGMELLIVNPIAWWANVAVWVVLPAVILFLFLRSWANQKRSALMESWAHWLKRNAGSASGSGDGNGPRPGH